MQDLADQIADLMMVPTLGILPRAILLEAQAPHRVRQILSEELEDALHRRSAGRSERTVQSFHLGGLSTRSTASLERQSLGFIVQMLQNPGMT